MRAKTEFLLRLFNGRCELDSADDEAVAWLTRHGSSLMHRKKKKNWHSHNDTTCILYAIA